MADKKEVIYKIGQEKNLPLEEAGSIIFTEDSKQLFIDHPATGERLEIGVNKDYVDHLVTSTKVGLKTPNGGEIFNTYLDDSANKAFGPGTAAFGRNSIAGCLGFKISNFVKGGYDALGQPYYAKITLNTDDSHFANIKVGDKVSVRINYNSTGLLVTAVDTSAKTVTLNDLLRSFPDFVVSDNDYLWLTEKPEAGDTSIGIGAFAGGFLNNQANQDGTLALGRNNIADGRWSVALGSGNEAGYNTFVYGKNNKALRSETSVILGNKNRLTGYVGDTLIQGTSNSLGNVSNSTVLGTGNAIASVNRATVLGTGNDNNTDKYFADVTMIGNHLRPHESNQVILGSYNEVNENHIFAVGFGTSEGTRKSTLNVFSDGSAEIYSQGTTDKSIAQKQYVDESILNVYNNQIFTIKKDTFNGGTWYCYPWRDQMQTDLSLDFTAVTEQEISDWAPSDSRTYFIYVNNKEYINIAFWSKDRKICYIGNGELLDPSYQKNSSPFVIWWDDSARITKIKFEEAFTGKFVIKINIFSAHIVLPDTVQIGSGGSDVSGTVPTIALSNTVFQLSPFFEITMRKELDINKLTVGSNLYAVQIPDPLEADPTGANVFSEAELQTQMVNKRYVDNKFVKETNKELAVEPAFTTTNLVSANLIAHRLNADTFILNLTSTTNLAATAGDAISFNLAIDNYQINNVYQVVMNNSEYFEGSLNNYDLANGIITIKSKALKDITTATLAPVKISIICGIDKA